ncbi:hypothetical protein [Paenibacillus cucumis (ex Kampfer et al. 2016)]|uniref:Uncharacterized protein n=1 Tax=Paenibacillus cucumis (ex Kampfer et al. 2016) TaxID=1776858 RepID=A0ABS7KDH4_9BACL|nr:hypothetical protein [Paenibacillus cucumis (ex Kampfer et al. 2016)]MBY0202006.1 hypothetical protein [Paenibacillus cucumis (ex Kampfer et al. 2016)]
MTLTIVFAGEKFSLAAADHRRTKIETGEFMDDVQKVARINNHVMAAYSGIYIPDQLGQMKGLAEGIITAIRRERGKSLDCLGVEEVTQMYSKAMQDAQLFGVNKNEMDVTFHFTGRLSRGGFAVGRVSKHEDFEPIVTLPGQCDGLAWSLSMAEVSPSPWIIGRLASMTELSRESVTLLTEEMFPWVADQDKYVSPTFSVISL